MGKFIYGGIVVLVDIDDCMLAYLCIVIMMKLCRVELFMFDIDVGGGNGWCTFWVYLVVLI